MYPDLFYARGGKNGRLFTGRFRIYGVRGKWVPLQGLFFLSCPHMLCFLIAEKLFCYFILISPFAGLTNYFWHSFAIFCFVLDPLLDIFILSFRRPCAFFDSPFPFLLAFQCSTQTKQRIPFVRVPCSTYRVSQPSGYHSKLLSGNSLEINSPSFLQYLILPHPHCHGQYVVYTKLYKTVRALRTEEHQTVNDPGVLQGHHVHCAIL